MKQSKSVESRERPNPLLVAALGASAGGLEAFTNFFDHMPGDAGIAFVVVQHLAPDHKSALTELLGKHTRMAVEQVLDGTKILPNRVYVIPPNTTLTIESSTLRLAAAEPRAIRKPIDSLFRSLAEDRGENAVCIMLSGTGNDGTIGLTAIKEHGGMAMAQSPDSAEYDAILQSAIATGLVDHVLPVEEMPAKLVEYAKHLSFTNEDGKVPSGSIREQIGKHRRKIHELLRRSGGNDFSHYKENTVIRRIERRMNALQIESVEHYVELLQSRPEEVALLSKDLLIGVTHFFRDPEAFKMLNDTVIPKLFEGKGRRDSVRACIMGCASGEEAYSIAILMCEHASTLEAPPSIQVFATDIDERGLETARKGRYPMDIAEHVSPERLARFFTNGNGSYQVTRELRELCIFSNHSFIKDPPFTRLDLLSCRNVMIYLGADLQDKVLPLFHYALRSGGYLFLGPAENVTSHKALFRTVDKKHRIFQRKETLKRPQIRLPLLEAGNPRQSGNHQPQSDDSSLPKQLERIILKRHGPACVVVDDQGDAVYFSGRINRYLEQPTGSPENNVVNMAREGVRLPLRTSLHKTVTTRARTVQKVVSVQTNGEVNTVQLTIEPLTEFQNTNLYMIVFEELASIGSLQSNGGATTFDAGSEEIIRHLETELRAAQEHAQAAYEELETTNEELKSSNEEYQSTNEELEAAKAEFQSFNKELEAVNAELSRNVAELKRAENTLRTANRDLQHFAFAASHDLQEPLRMVTSYTQLLEREYKDKLGPSADQFIAYAVRGAQRIESLLKHLREYLSVDEQRLPKPVPIECEWILTQVLDVLAAEIQESSATVTRDPLPTVSAEETPLMLLFQNLIANALRYHREGEPPHIHVEAVRSGDVWTFSITDNGIGIEPHHAETIFAPFKRLHGSERPGSGLGLAICQRIVERYQGRIWVESDYGHGSTFYFTLPADKEVK